MITRERNNECPHKEILLSRYIVKDLIGGGEFHLCPTCYNKIKNLTGYKVIQHGNPPYIIRPLLKPFDDIPF